MTTRLKRAGPNPWTGVESQTLHVPRPTVEALVRREVDAAGDLRMRVQRDLLTGTRIVHLRPQSWWRRYHRRAEVKLRASGPQKTLIAARADVRAPTRLTALWASLGVPILVSMWVSLALQLPVFGPHFAGTGVLTLGLLVLARWDGHRRRRGFRDRIQGLLDRTYAAARRVEQAPGQLSLAPGPEPAGALALVSRSDPRWG